MNANWWEDQMFTYIYRDGDYTVTDYEWLKELNYIASEFEEFGWGWCLRGQHWKPNKLACWSDDF